MYIFIILIHVIVSLVLIFVVLLQAGRGGGMSEMIGGGQPSSIFGTQTNEFMTKATEVCAVLFIITSLTLGIMSTQRGKSLVDRRQMPTLPPLSQSAKLPALPAVAKADVAAPAVEAVTEAVKTETAKAAPAAAENVPATTQAASK